MTIYHQGYVIDGNFVFLGDFCGRPADLVKEEGDALSARKILDHMVVKRFQFFHLVKTFAKCYRNVMDEYTGSELRALLKKVQKMINDLDQKFSKLEQSQRNSTTESDSPIQYQTLGPDSVQFKKFHGALFHRVNGRYENTVFCENRKVPLENSDNNHLKCPVCRKAVEFTPAELPAFVKALNSGKAG